MQDYKLAEIGGVQTGRLQLSEEQRNKMHKIQPSWSRRFQLVTRTARRLGVPACARTHANAIRRATAFRSSDARYSLLHLQRHYGNHYVQRVLAMRRPASAGAAVQTDVEETIQSARGGGRQLDKGVRSQMESSFGADFGGVRVHTDSQAAALNQTLNARAFTTGQDIFFGRGNYDPGSSGGRELLAHELTHVVQQNKDEIQPKLTVGQPGDRYEQEADSVARAVMQQEYGDYSQAPDKAGVRRQPEEEEESLQMQPMEEEEEELQSKLQRQEEEEEVQTKT